MKFTSADQLNPPNISNYLLSQACEASETARINCTSVKLSVLLPTSFSYRRSEGALAWYLRSTLGRSFCGGAYLLSAGPGPTEASDTRWGVVQLVGHLTVNEDGEGSNPSAPANSSP